MACNRVKKLKKLFIELQYFSRIIGWVRYTIEWLKFSESVFFSLLDLEFNNDWIRFLEKKVDVENNSTYDKCD